MLKSASAHHQLSEVLRLGAEYDEAHRVAEKGHQLFRQLSDEMFDTDEARTVRASLLGASGMAKVSARDYASAEWSFRECLAVREQLCAPNRMTCRAARRCCWHTTTWAFC